MSLDKLYEESEDGTLEWTIDSAAAKERIDKYVKGQLDEEVSRSQIQLWIEAGNLVVNGTPVKANHKLAEGDRVVLTIPEPEAVEIAPEDIPLDIYYEDSDVIVVNKARGMVVHPAPGHASGTLVNALLFHCKDLSGINGELRPGIVHRIDKDTSGLIMAAKNDKAHASLAEQLKAHSVTRKYYALVHGNVSHDQGTVDAPIGRDPYDRKMYTVIDRNSKSAVTHFQVVERFGDYTLLELKLETGRTHQIRVHMKFIGHPLVGDPLYGRSKGVKMNGQALHAAVLGFDHPADGRYLEFSAPIPDDMEDVLLSLRNR
ncbi:RluA family pseudouridine synthase [Paenibacillus macerans]|uniref:Pseudouridine synthase n=1 Tax=Paenibacillus macerans TaxID=44252 RepID=A0A090ZFG7_PAEMA|nr:RluA family pseudouridine synthase [Paenibacillus macerans]KFN10049.1 pseudouridine synthase, RluA family protein [Paenibacillus macerans]MBS5911666.1 RluA family pseudouridine synthase [Paenibacillus macerans]MCY7557533.1 RluA family pseudouridine synthase [Paenibacillus macerans]MDU5946945.1 RluA family pseudouridine synthase [Paenibacillus macerans]MEC0141218.1 RluA family pseudouridine synthase [Paenibacillus macerans]